MTAVTAVTLPFRVCPVCQSSDRARVFTKHFAPITGRAGLSGYDVASCHACGMLYAPDIPSAADLHAYYADESKYAYAGRGGWESEADRFRLHDVALRLTRCFPNRNATLLDVGCATGRLLYTLRLQGYHDTLGIDLSAPCREIADEHYNVRVAERTDDRFDGIILSGVLEHLHDPAVQLDWVRQHLTPTGKVYVEVPDARGFPTYPTEPYQELSTEHVNFFTQGTLQRLLASVGFVVEWSERGSCLRAGDRRVANLACCAAMEDPTDGLLAMRDYLATSQGKETAWRDRLSAMTTPFYLWGAGTLTRHLVGAGVTDGLPILGILDSDPALHGKTLGPYPIFAPSTDRVREVVIPVSDGHAEEIERQIASLRGGAAA